MKYLLSMEGTKLLPFDSNIIFMVAFTTKNIKKFKNKNKSITKLEEKVKVLQEETAKLGSTRSLLNSDAPSLKPKESPPAAPNLSSQSPLVVSPVQKELTPLQSQTHQQMTQHLIILNL